MRVSVTSCGLGDRRLRELKEHDPRNNTKEKLNRNSHHSSRCKVFPRRTVTDKAVSREGVLVRARAVYRRHRDVKQAQVYRQLSAVVVPMIQHNRP